MNGGSIENALDRIEAALIRIEDLAALPQQSDAGLHARHERLKTSVSQALDRLDSLISARGG